MPIVLKVAVKVPVNKLFDYLPPLESDSKPLQPGIRLEVPFGRRNLVGVLVGTESDTSVPAGNLKNATRVLDAEPLLSPKDLNLLVWASRYYLHPIGEVIAAAFPSNLRKIVSARIRPEHAVLINSECPTDAESHLVRAPKQLFLLQKLRATPAGIPSNQLGPEALTSAAKSLVTKGFATWKTIATATKPYPMPNAPFQSLTLNTEQQSAVDHVCAALNSYGTFLLNGITGSGKTEVYIRLAEEALNHQRQIMILLPEINLTPQIEARFQERFSSPLVLFHSRLSESERQTAWLGFQSGEAKILLGTRSAVFNPAKSLGLIIIDEEHDSSFKQQEGFRFSARDVAVVRAKALGIPIVMGSATPSLETLHNVLRQRYDFLELPRRAGVAKEPTYRVLDIRAQKLQEGISVQLKKLIQETLASGDQALLFVSRRGFAPTLICHDCGWVARCPRCEANLVIHAAERTLRCHQCDLEENLPKHCSSCGKKELKALGLGTERIESALTEDFPNARISRIDRDSTKHKGSLEKVLEGIQKGEINILIGTQMVAKGHHFPRVTLVGIIDVDAGLYSTDFRAEERTAQLIVQVAGRAGREEKPGLVVLQTRHPEHPLIQRLIHRGYKDFSNACLIEREQAQLPPFSHQVLFRSESSDPLAGQQFLKAISEQIQSMGTPALFVLGPAPAPLSRKANRYRWQLLLQSQQRSQLHSALDVIIETLSLKPRNPRVSWSIDVDPLDLF
jgi:primosomal protein N' (replication factor Y)